jgi:hypothetical protein
VTKISNKATFTPVSPLHSSPISAVYSSEERVDIWILGNKRRLKHLTLQDWEDSSWTIETGLFSNAAVIFSRGEPDFDIIAFTADGRVLYQAKDEDEDAEDEDEDGEPEWEDLGGAITSPLSAVS